MIGKTLLAIVTMLALIVGSVACDSASPVAPPGTVLTITASPSRIASDGVSTVRVTALKPNGTPVNPGTLIRLSTTIGSIASTVSTDNTGEATTQLSGNGDFGVATVSATIGSGEAATVDVTIGLLAASITLQATPTSVPETGGNVDLLAVVRDDQSQPLKDATVNFSATVGALESGGQLRRTDDQGTVTDLLMVTSGDLDAVQGDTFEIAVEVGGSGGTLISDSDTISILRLPKADFSFSVDNLTVVFTDTSTGQPRQWLWDFGDGNTSRLQNPIHTYSIAGAYTVQLTATNSQGSDTIPKRVSVSGQ